MTDISDNLETVYMILLKHDKYAIDGLLDNLY